jgi:hypothetical protein
MKLRTGFLILAVFCMSLPIGVAAQTPSPSPLADEADAARVIDTVTTWLKRAGSDNPEVRLRAWDGLSEEYKQFFFAGDPAQFSHLRSTVYTTGDVTIDEERDRFGVDVTLSGFINEHGLYTMHFVVTRDFLIDDHFSAPELEVPDELESTTVRVVVTDEEIRVNHPEFENNDAVVVLVTNEGTQSHQLQVFRVNDGQTVETLMQLVTTTQPIDGVATPYGFAMALAGSERVPIGMINTEPGTYVVAGFTPGDSLFGVYAAFEIADQEAAADEGAIVESDAAPTQAVDTGSGENLPADYLGTWAGTGVQADQGVEWEVVLTLSGGSIGTVVGTSSYPELGCEGTLTLIMFDQIYPPYAKLEETIIAGQDVCANGTFSVSFAEFVQGMLFTWTSATSGSIATGTLRQIG